MPYCVSSAEKETLNHCQSPWRGYYYLTSKNVCCSDIQSGDYYSLLDKNEGHCVRTTRDRQIMLRLLTVSFVDAVANVTASRED